MLYLISRKFKNPLVVAAGGPTENQRTNLWWAAGGLTEEARLILFSKISTAWQKCPSKKVSLLRPIRAQEVNTIRNLDKLVI